MQIPAFKSRFKLLVGFSLLAILVVGGILFTRGVEGRSVSKQPANALDQLEAACIHDMVARTCKVMNSADRPPTAAPGEVVFVAGIGAIDAADYQQMYAAGEGMCAAVRQACERDWTSRQCQTARALYPTL